MAIYNFDMQFIYAFLGWEGYAHDMFMSVLRNSNMEFPKPSLGNDIYSLIKVWIFGTL